MCRTVREIVHRLLSENGVAAHCDVNVVDVELLQQTADAKDDAGTVRYLLAEDGRRFPFDEAIWCTEVSAVSLLREKFPSQLTRIGVLCVTSGRRGALAA